jgi:hypothetical protein
MGASILAGTVYFPVSIGARASSASWCRLSVYACIGAAVSAIAPRTNPLRGIAIPGAAEAE